MSIESSSVYKKLNLLEAIYIRLLGPDFRYRIGVSGPYTDLFFWNVLHNRCEPVTCQLHPPQQVRAYASNPKTQTLNLRTLNHKPKPLN